ncbi:MAG TPA: 3,4-dihydroxy-2-butanone-4-phosphate synthase, partial [Alphaproteobacteria bacterium]|nr:3,4-dihydroxy-2-butanone-4-phosphate synthase [Alphaproteobacteria bacterium]
MTQSAMTRNSQALSDIEEVIEEARNGRMIILVDDEDRENEGDLVIPAQMATPDAINFMAKYGRGLICLAMTTDRVEELGLSLMSSNNQTRHQTAFTVSIEASEGVTTGISAADRAHTISVAIDPSRGSGDLRTPGHVFPLVARDGGVLVRAGHTEAAVDIARLAGLIPAGVICEIMNDDGTMARLPDLEKFARVHGIKVATISDLIAYRRRNDRLIECVAETPIESRYGGDLTMKVYGTTVDYAEHIALVKGDIRPDEPVLVRMHVMNAFEDLIGEVKGRVGTIGTSLRLIEEEGKGVLVCLFDTRRTWLSDAVRSRNGEADASGPPVLRDYGIGAQILLDLGVREMILLSNTRRTVVGLEGYGLSIAGQRPIPV